jgi:hypothetical protein
MEQVDPFFPTQDAGSGSPAHFATTYGQLDMLHHLLRRVPEAVNLRDRCAGMTPLHRYLTLSFASMRTPTFASVQRCIALYSAAHSQPLPHPFVQSGPALQCTWVYGAVRVPFMGWR